MLGVSQSVPVSVSMIILRPARVGDVRPQYTPAPTQLDVFSALGESGFVQGDVQRLDYNIALPFGRVH